MDELKERHRKALRLLSQKVYTKYELRLYAKFNPNTTNEVLNTLAAFNLIHPLSGERGEGIRLTEKGNEMAATIVLEGLQLTQ